MIRTYKLVCLKEYPQLYLKAGDKVKYEVVLYEKGEEIWPGSSCYDSKLKDYVHTPPVLANGDEYKEGFLILEDGKRYKLGDFADMQLSKYFRHEN